MADINLYLGAHKTATTHLQGILLANRERLQAKSIGLSAPQDVRKEWLPKFFKYCNAPGERKTHLGKYLRDLRPDARTWILTEENIIGVSNDLAVKSGIYPFAAQRLKALVELFGDDNVTLFFSIRSYGSFYRSAYSEVVRNRGYIPFDEFYDEGRFADNSWVDFVQRVQEVFPQDRITLWRFEDFRGLVPRLLQAMTGLDSVQELIDAYKAETTRPSLSQKTMDILADLHPVISRQESLALVERINKAYPVETGNVPYMPFTDAQEAEFRDKYEKDVAEIKSRFPQVTFLEA